MSLAMDAGVQAPTGDPGQVSAAAGWHERVADFMEGTAGEIEYTVGSVMGANWTGEAAFAYGQLGVLVAAHFRHGGSVARSAAQTLRRYAGQLEQLQREGVTAVQQTVHWLQQLQHDQHTLTNAQDEVARAEGAVRGAEAAVKLAALTPTPGAAVAHLGHDLSAAQHRLNTAQTAERQAQRAVDDDEHQVAHWRQRARQIWQEAQNAAAVATGNLEPLAAPPPPLAGAPATFTGALAADAPFLASHLQLSRGLAQQIAQRNASKNHLGHNAVSTDEQHVLSALEHGQNLDSVPLSQPHHSSGGGILQDIAAVGVPVVTEILGGGPEDPLADGAVALEEGAIEGGGDAAAGAAGAGSEAAASAGSEATAAEDAAGTGVGVDRGDGRDVLGKFTGGNGYGADAEAEGLAQYEAETGDPVIDAHVRATLPDGSTRYYDGLTPNGDGTYTGIEIKSNSASLSSNQRTFDGAVDSGQAATAKLNGQPIRITRVVYRQVTR